MLRSRSARTRIPWPRSTTWRSAWDSRERVAHAAERAQRAVGRRGARLRAPKARVDLCRLLKRKTRQKRDSASGCFWFVSNLLEYSQCRSRRRSRQASQHGDAATRRRRLRPSRRALPGRALRARLQDAVSASHRDDPQRAMHRQARQHGHAGAVQALSDAAALAAARRKSWRR